MSTLAAAAFGDQPGRWPLPSPRAIDEQWLRAVAAGGQGRYASASADLAAIDVCAPRGRLASLALSTRASLLRQLGWHTVARGWDGRALAAADGDAEASADAVTGLAADALGTGRFDLSDRLLAKAEDFAGSSACARLPVRIAWVRAELAMATGRGTEAVEHAERAVVLAGALGSVRHAVKSDVVHAAALCCAGATRQARRIADAALTSAEHHHLVPLSWALTCLLGDVGSAARSAQDVTALRAARTAAVRARGGAWA